MLYAPRTFWKNMKLFCCEGRSLEPNLKVLPRGKNVTFENRCCPCFLSSGGSYACCKITVEASVAEPAIPHPPAAVFTMSERQARIESEIIENLKSGSHNQNVTG